MARPTAQTAPRRGRPPRGASQLSRPAIVAAALEVIDADGLAGVSVRAVARSLGVDPKSLYNHVDGKDGILDAVAEHMLAGIRIPQPTGDAHADLTAIAHAFRDRALTHPQAATLILTRQLASLEGLAPVEAVLATLRDAGFSTEHSVRLLRAFVAAVVGALLREVDAGPTYGTTDETAIAARRAALEASGLPATAAAAEHLARFDGAREFAFTLAIALQAVDAGLATPG